MKLFLPKPHCSYLSKKIFFSMFFFIFYNYLWWCRNEDVTAVIMSVIIFRHMQIKYEISLLWYTRYICVESKNARQNQANDPYLIEYLCRMSSFYLFRLWYDGAIVSFVMLYLSEHSTIKAHWYHALDNFYRIVRGSTAVPLKYVAMLAVWRWHIHTHTSLSSTHIVHYICFRSINKETSKEVAGHLR